MCACAHVCICDMIILNLNHGSIEINQSFPRRATQRTPSLTSTVSSLKGPHASPTLCRHILEELEMGVVASSL